MATIIPKRDLDRAIRDFYLSQTPQSVQSGAVAAGGASPAVAIIEVPWAGRTAGALQVFSTDGNAISATFKAQGTLLSADYVAVGPPSASGPASVAFRVPGVDADWIDLATQAGVGIVQFTGGYLSRVRVICSAYVSGQPGVRLL